MHYKADKRRCYRLALFHAVVTIACLLLSCLSFVTWWVGILPFVLATLFALLSVRAVYLSTLSVKIEPYTLDLPNRPPVSLMDITSVSLAKNTVTIHTTRPIARINYLSPHHTVLFARALGARVQELRRWKK